MKAVILAGGLGTRISEETVVRPKPMVEIGVWFDFILLNI
jgi:glucose-1-phosphate cytidylyltransferase